MIKAQYLTYKYPKVDFIISKPCELLINITYYWSNNIIVNFIKVAKQLSNSPDNIWDRETNGQRNEDKASCTSSHLNKTI